MSELIRITETAWKNLDPWECCGQDKYCKRGCHTEGGCANGCIVPKLYDRLASYEDTGRLPNEIAALDHDVAMLKQSARLVNEIAVDRDTWKRIAKVFESCLHNQCRVCVFGIEGTKSNESICNNCLGRLKNKSWWKFDEARFLTGGDDK